MTILLPVPAESGNTTVLREIVALKRIAENVQNVVRLFFTPVFSDPIIEVRANHHVARIDIWRCRIPGNDHLGNQPMIRIERVPAALDELLDDHPGIDPEDLFDAAYRTWIWVHPNRAAWEAAWRMVRELAVDGSTTAQPGAIMAVRSGDAVDVWEDAA